MFDTNAFVIRGHERCALIFSRYEIQPTSIPSATYFRDAWTKKVRHCNAPRNIYHAAPDARHDAWRHRSGISSL